MTGDRFIKADACHLFGISRAKVIGKPRALGEAGAVNSFLINGILFFQLVDQVCHGVGIVFGVIQAVDRNNDQVLFRCDLWPCCVLGDCSRVHSASVQHEHQRIGLGLAVQIDGFRHIHIVFQCTDLFIFGLKGLQRLSDVHFIPIVIRR